MAGKADIEAGRAYVSLLLKDKGFVKGLDAAGARLKSVGKGISIFGAAIAGVGASITGPMLAAVHGVVEAGSAMQLMSERTGLTVESLSELRYAAEQSGATIEDVQKALLLGAKKGFSPEKFDEIAASLAKIEDPGKRVEAAFKIFGKGAAQILPMLGNLQELRQEARDLGLVMSGKTAAAAHHLHNSFNTLGRIIGGVKGAIGAALIPTVQTAVEWQIRIAKTVRDWVRENKEMFVSAFRIGAILTAVGTAIAAFGGFVALSGAALIGINAAIGTLVAVLGAVLSPIGLVIGGLVALATWFATSTEYGRQMVKSLVGWFGDLKDIALETFGGIADALASGNLALAAEVAWAGIKLAWLKGTDEIRKTWIGFKNLFIQSTLGVVFKAQEYWARLASSVKAIWAGMVTTSKSVGESIGHWLSRSSDPAVAADQDRAHNVALQQIEREGKAEQSRIEETRNSEIAAIEEAHKMAAASADAKTQEQLKTAADNLKAAQAKLKGLTDTATKERRDHDLAAGPELKKPGEFNLGAGKIKDQIVGSFSANALLAQGGGQSPTEKQQRETNRLLHEQLRKMDDQRRELARVNRLI